MNLLMLAVFIVGLGVVIGPGAAVAGFIGLVVVALIGLAFKLAERHH